jgi:hypothetical protein
MLTPTDGRTIEPDAGVRSAGTVIIRGVQASIAGLHGVVTSHLESGANGRRKGVVDEELHCAWRSGSLRSRTAAEA